MRQVCRESHQVSQARGGFPFGKDDSVMGGLWFDFFSDILYMFRYIGQDYTIAIHNTRNVALVWPDVTVLGNLQRMKDFIVEYLKCRRIILIVTFDRMHYYSDMKSYPIGDDDPVDDAPEDRESLKDSLERSWRKKSALQYLGVTEAQLPKIEAM